MVCGSFVHVFSPLQSLFFFLEWGLMAGLRVYLPAMGAVFYLGAGWLQRKHLGIPGTHLPLKRGSWLTCFVLSFSYGGVMGCGEQVTNWLCFLQSSFALHSLDFELSRISLSVSLDSLLYYLFLHQSSITVHVRRSTHLLFMIS